MKLTKIDLATFEDFTSFYQLVEKFGSQTALDQHYEKHVVRRKEFDYTKEEYEQRAEELAKTPVNHKNILGYLEKNNKTNQFAYIKYNKDTEEFTAYYYNDKKEPVTITMYRKSFREYNSNKYLSIYDDYEYYDEIPTAE